MDANLSVFRGPLGQGWFNNVNTPIQGGGWSFQVSSQTPQMDRLGLHCLSTHVRRGNMRKLWAVLIQPSTLGASTRGSEERIIHAPFPPLVLCGKFCSSSFLVAYIQHTHTHTESHTVLGFDVAKLFDLFIGISFRLNSHSIFKKNLKIVQTQTEN